MVIAVHPEIRIESDDYFNKTRSRYGWGLEGVSGYKYQVNTAGLCK